ncbi:MAG: hypothetical protein UX44_C0014G0006 [candidate division WWE3 bacterium GW2011_GWA1_46_21]|uniref:Uncharacterized protein n=4 Tax=Katanobacteria TaxID=422282 RepID=A0A0G1PDA3_UNCKA|nr:MAG: hypothetical protein UX44_C0014G0006 [candidate division WWE3 bacterium GW2011_GWA1_46_21]KKU49374.1 MAG: hypothetical protein UX69_C0003G0026 [candidate division WWE3 bacterium GW2011_GWA2_46_9]KKU51273.1 MAG: hypothetical protein UX73_C0004G0019 [candidate division WWE3 bacterium GW2011_GWC1_47_10]KKU57935.1 MAG: hypothetical protein UX79_C0003G0005 [candidate division WWE3 bacterium GW2011_GWB1_47_11]
MPTEKVIARNKAKEMHTIGFLLVQDNSRIVLAEELDLEINSARTTHVIYPEYAKNMIYLAPIKGITPD